MLPGAGLNVPALLQVREKRRKTWSLCLDGI